MIKSTEEQLIDLEFEKTFNEFLAIFPHFKPHEKTASPAMAYFFKAGFDRSTYYAEQRRTADIRSRVIRSVRSND
jgi:hypothetical protein